MIPLKDIKIGKADAINYYKSKDKDFLRKIFFNDEKFKEILKQEVYFLLGDKGTGKTAFAVYSVNNETEGHKASLKFTSETDFKKFVKLVNDGKISISDYVSIWKVIMLLLVSQEIKTNIQDSFLNKYFLLTKIEKAINSYYKSAFSPEITNAIEIIDKAEIFLEILKGSLGGKNEKTEIVKNTGLQVNLHEIENAFKKALQDINIKKNFILFVDGTDQIPFDIKKNDYIDCLRGLANAVWELNQFIFPELIGHNDFYIKVVLLIRPDIFSFIRFHNANAKLKDNSVILNWVTRESTWRNSRLFKLADNIFSSQQISKFALGYCWDEYCEKHFEVNFTQDSFYTILKRTFMRPRDIFAILDIMHKEAIKTNSPKITSQIFQQSQAEFARYLLGEVKDQFNFFYSDEHWQTLMDFFKYFDGRNRFDFDFFHDCYSRFTEDYPTDNPDFFDTPELLLQELYSYNFICYIQESSNEDFFYWAYREKGYTNLNPLVDYESEYMFHLGLTRAIGIGKPINKRRNGK